MGTTNQLIRTLIENRVGLVHEMRSIVNAAEHRQKGVLTGEQEQTVERLNSEIDSLGERINELGALQKSEAALAEQRKKFEHIFHADARDDYGPKRSVVRDALRGVGPRVFEADFRNLKHRVEADGRTVIEARDLSKATDAAGKFTVPQDFLNELFRHLVENSGVRAAGARQITTDDGRDMPVPKTLTHGGAAAVAENATIPESDPTFGQATLQAWKFGQLIQVSNELATDTGVDLDSYLAEAAGSNLGLASGNEYVNGDGTTEPDGVAVSPVIGKTGTTGRRSRCSVMT